MFKCVFAWFSCDTCYLCGLSHLVLCQACYLAFWDEVYCLPSSCISKKECHMNRKYRIHNPHTKHKTICCTLEWNCMGFLCSTNRCSVQPCVPWDESKFHLKKISTLDHVHCHKLSEKITNRCYWWCDCIKLWFF
jgi:hypothetical protein